ncbi:MAG: hypothetical protein N3A58_00445 [Spirochaetes bacterium]|nr:hypothetical protein [Spirochaetota bacterium]
MNKYKYSFILILIFLSIFLFLSIYSNLIAQETTPYETIGTVAIYIFDPYNSIPLTAERYAMGNFQDYLYLNKIKSYYLGKMTLEAAIVLAKDKGVDYLIQVKGNLSEIINSVEGYGATYYVELDVIQVKDRKVVLSSSNKASVERTLSESIAQAYSFSTAVRGSIDKILKDLLSLFKKQ